MSDGPEARYAEMTSGRPAEIDTAIEACRTTMNQLADAIDLIALATDLPEWDSTEAYETYNLRAWVTRASAEVSYVRVNRVKLALDMAGSWYDEMVDQATTVIDQWRTTKRSDLSGDVLELYRALAMLNLWALQTALSGRLAEAIDFISTDPLSGQEQDWTQLGMIKSMLHDLNGPNDLGPTIPNTFATGDDDGGWTPQGLGYDPDGDPPTLLQGSYSGSGDDIQAQLSLVDPETGEQLGFVDLGGHEGGLPPDHAGGVSVRNGMVYVMSSNTDDREPQMYVYPLDQIRGATPGTSVEPQGAPIPVPASAYSTIDGDTLYVGSFEKDGPGSLYTYEWDPSLNDGAGGWPETPSGPVPTPPQTQGIAVVDGQVVFSTSFGRTNGSHLVSYELSDVMAGHGASEDHELGSVRLPNMTQGVVAVDGQGLITTNEAGSYKFTDADDPDDLDSLWAAQNMTLTPFSALGLNGGAAAGGVTVTPVSLEQASTDFDAGGTRLGNASTTVAGVTLGAGCFGTNSTGDQLATLVTTHSDETSQWITDGRLSADVTADGLLSSAQSYVETDQLIREIFGGLINTLDGS